MTRLAYPDPAYVAQVILRVTHRTHAQVVVGWYWTVGHPMTSLDLEPEPAPTVSGTHTLQMSA